MRLRAIIALLLPCVAAAGEHWLLAKAGPFQVLSEAGDRAARDNLMFLEQFRQALGVAIGKPDLKLVFPLRAVALKNAGAAPETPRMARDAYLLAVSGKAEFPPETLRALARLLLEQNTTRLPAGVESGLAELFSTLQVEGTRIRLGAPVAPAARNRDWARMHLLTVSPEYFGRTRVLINNLEQGADLATAYRNAYEKTAAQIDRQLDAYIQAANFGTIAVSAKALNPARDFRVEAVESDQGRIAAADLLFAAESPGAEAAYASLRGPVAAEGLGLIALRNHKDAEAKRLLESAAQSGSVSSRAWLELGALEAASAQSGAGQSGGEPSAGGGKAFADLKKAAELNQHWGEPAFRLARIEPDAGRKIFLLKQAAALDPRNIDYWQTLARAEIDAKQFVDAQKAWAGAERAAATEEERNRIREARLQVDRERAEFEASERKRVADERERDIDRVKAQSEAEIRAAEAAANKKLNPRGEPVPKAVDWWSDAAGNAQAEGVLQRFDCLGARARIAVATSAGVVLLLIPEPSRIALAGGGEKTLSCGPQRPARKAFIQYNTRADPKFRTAGDVVSIEFR